MKLECGRVRSAGQHRSQASEPSCVLNVKGKNVPESRNKEFVERYRKTLDETRARGRRSSFSEEDLRLESCLCLMLERYLDDIPPIESDRFHKTFRQCDVVDNDAPQDVGGKMDMVIWHLLGCQCTMFWNLQGKWIEKLKREEPPTQPIGSETSGADD